MPAPVPTREELILKAKNARRNSYFLYLIATSQEQRLLGDFNPDEATAKVIDTFLQVLAGDDDSMASLMDDLDEEMSQKIRLAMGDEMFAVMNVLHDLFRDKPDWDAADLFEVAQQAGIVL